MESILGYFWLALPTSHVKQPMRSCTLQFWPDLPIRQQQQQQQQTTTTIRMLIFYFFLCFFCFSLLPRPGRGTGYCFRAISLFVCLFVCLFVSLSATLRENAWADLHDIFREGVEWPWDDLIKFWVNSGKRVGGSKVNLSPAIAQSQLHSLGGSRGRGLSCPAPQLVLFYFILFIYFHC